MKVNYMTYLTEEGLGNIFDELLPNEAFVHDKSVPGATNKRFRPDYRFEDRKLIIEFDGDSHYREAKRIITDREKDADYSSLGYRVVRIPYFIQMNNTVLKFIFGPNTELTFEQIYPHGFIDKNARLPADFCELGIQKFKQDLLTFAKFKEDILKSLVDKINQLDDLELVIPLSLQKILP